MLTQTTKWKIGIAFEKNGSFHLGYDNSETQKRSFSGPTTGVVNGPMVDPKLHMKEHRWATPKTAQFLKVVINQIN